jgi:DNA mismatch repair protein MLH1
MRKQLEPFEETTCRYSSVQNMLAAIGRGPGSHEAQLVVKHHSFVGLVDTRFAAVQYQTKLLLLNFSRLTRLLFYQLAVRRFGCLPSMRLAEPVSVTEFARAALDLPEAGWTSAEGDKDELAATISGVLVEKAELLSEYFRIDIDSSGNLTGVPELLHGYCPSPHALPMFFIRLACDTNWGDEQECFTNIAQHLADLYSCLGDEGTEGAAAQAYVPGRALGADAADVVECTIMPALRAYLHVPISASTDGSIVQITALEALYRVFERC